MRHKLHSIAWYAGGAAFALLIACERQRHAGEPGVVRRLAVDTAPPAAAQIELMRSQGESVFYGLVGNGTCSRCHDGRVASGETTISLQNSTWVRSASFAAVVHYIAHGRRDPRQDTPGRSHPGGDALTGEQVRAVAAYLKSVSPLDAGSTTR